MIPLPLPFQKDKKMTKAKPTLASLQKQVNQMVTKVQFSRLERKFEQLDHKIDKLAGLMQQGFEHLTMRLVEQQRQLNELKDRVDTLHGLMENLLVRVERLEQEYTMITAALKRLEKRFDALDALRLKDRVDSLEKRVTALESIQN
jgi:chromosome segregation ATPase